VHPAGSVSVVGVGSTIVPPSLVVVVGVGGGGVVVGGVHRPQQSRFGVYSPTLHSACVTSSPPYLADFEFFFKKIAIYRIETFNVYKKYK
jgi:hypothetical protein